MGRNGCGHGRPVELAFYVISAIKSCGLWECSILVGGLKQSLSRGMMKDCKRTVPV